jgi:phenylacetate-CoA ligase
MNPTAIDQLQEMLREVVPRNPFWASRLIGSDWKSIADPAGMAKLPLTTKADLVADQAAAPPYGTNLTYPRPAYSRVHQTSGTTGRPLRCVDTPKSWQWVLSCWERIYELAGIRSDDVFAFPFSFGPFLGFWGAFEGAQRLGRMCLAGGGLSSEARLMMIAENSATIVCCTPTYALRLAETAESLGHDLRSGSVRALVVAGEPGGNVPQIRERIEAAWGARVAVEPQDDPGGLLLLDDKCIAEIIDPATGEPKSPNEEGELVITNLGRWGQPLLRYRTGDLVRPRPRNDRGMYLEGGVQGRADDMFIVRGNNVFPSSIEAVIREFDEIVEYRMTLREQRAMPHLLVEIEPRESAGELAERLRQRIKDRLSFQPEVVLCEPGGLPRFDLKGRRFIRAT